jgi:hypothetical protein
MKSTSKSRLWPTEGFRRILDNREAESNEEVVCAKRARRGVDMSLVALTIATIGALLSLFIIIRSPTWITDCEECTSPFTQQMDFSPHAEFEDLSSKSDFEWERLLTPNDGFLVREIDSKRQNWGISMFHQLHCLQVIRTELQLLMNLTTLQELQPKKYPRGVKEHHDSGHVVHCVDYLRQVCHDYCEY